MRTSRGKRSAAAAVEFAILLPFLVFLVVIAVDYGRIFYYSLTVTTCARNGALYAYDPYSKVNSPYANVTEAALADASNLTPQPTVTSTSGTDSKGSYVECTVTYEFHTLTRYPGVPDSTPIVRTVRLHTAPRTPTP